MEMPNNISEKKRFSIIARARSFSHAFRGVGIIFKTQHNAWVHLSAVFFVVFLGLLLNINSYDWILLIFAITGVIVAEGFNTAIEIDMDLTSPNYHPYAKDTKDVASGAVLIAVFGSILVGLFVFLPYF